MTAYLNSKNRSVRFRRIAERAFEIFISNIDILFPCLTIIVYGIIIIALILGVADYATQDMSQPMRQSLP